MLNSTTVRKIGMMTTLLVLMLLILSPLVEARKGVGIKWTLNSVVVKEGEELCVDYGIYNPWEDDVTMKLTVGSELKTVTAESVSEPKFVKAGTSSSNAIPVNLCFKTTDAVYEKSCLLGSFLCAKSCSGSEKVYEGEVVASEVKNESSQGAFGSSTNIGVSTRLQVKVLCEPYSRDWTVAFGVILVIGILCVVYALRRRTMSKKGEIAPPTQV